MSEPLSIACSLDATEQPRRAAEIGALGRDGLLSAGRRGREAVLRFRSDHEIRARLERLVEAESRCCGFLRFELTGDAAATTLTISGPEGAEPALTAFGELFHANGARAAGTSSRSG
jgi:hypothetical protein